MNAKIMKKIDGLFQQSANNEAFKLELLIEIAHLIRTSGPQNCGDLDYFLSKVTHEGVLAGVKAWIRGNTPVIVSENNQTSLPKKVQANRWRVDQFRTHNPFERKMTKIAKGDGTVKTKAKDFDADLSKYLESKLSVVSEKGQKAIRMAQAVLSETPDALAYLSKGDPVHNADSIRIESLKVAEQSKKIHLVNEELSHQNVELSRKIAELEQALASAMKALDERQALAA